MDIYEPIILSLKVATISTIITLILGIFFAHIFRKYNFPFKDALEVIFTLPMTIPPTIVGYLLLMLFGKRGLFGKFLYETFGISIIFTWVAACIASTVVSMPLMYQSVKSAFQGIDPVYENAARTLGASNRKIFFKITVPLAFPGIVSGIVLSFSRALGEFGATLMVAGNIPGKTETIPLAIYYAVETNNQEKANILMLIVVAFSFINIFVLNKWLKKKRLN